MTTNAEASRNLLVYRLGHLGDTLIALPSLYAIRSSFPGARISLLTNAYPGAERVTPDGVIPSGLIDDWLTYGSDDGERNPFEMLRLFFRLRRRQFDTLVYLAPRIRGANNVRRDLLFFRAAGIPKVLGNLGFESLPKAQGNGLPTVTHETDHLLWRLALSGIHCPEAGQAKIDLALTQEEQQLADKWLEKHTLQQGPVKPLVAFAPGSKWPSKVWPEERYSEVGQRLITSHNVFPVVFGGGEDRQLGSRLIAQWGRGANAAGALPVRLAAAALRRCDLYVGNDTGTMHLAAAVNTRCVVAMSAIDWPGHWNPYGSGHVVLRYSVPCEGCLLHICDKEGLRCLKEITVDEMFKACSTVLSSKPLSPGLNSTSDVRQRQAAST